ncbi:Acetyl-coenzyme A synthetase, cytoplasmic [Branchiostoma belcheri]|nr:Acetyl-coenzyme A synthetase, cytoplasmic [Branchiostoma belcheri]
MSSCEGIEEESNELETESGMEGGQSMPSSSDDVGPIDAPQVPPQSLPQGPPQSLPQVPPQSLPQVPPQSLPQLPPQSLPQVPPQLLPQVPLQSLAQVPPQSLPQVPPPSLPQLPPQSLPQLPPQSLPQLPPQSLPQLPPQSLPQLPPQSLPQLPPQSLPQVPPQTAGFAPFMFLPGFNPGTLPQVGYPFPQNSIIIMNNCNNIQFGNQNTINSTQHHEHHPGGKFDGLDPDMVRMLINLVNPEEEKQMVNDLQDEDKRKDFVSGLKAFGTQLKTARGGCVLLDFELSKDPEERLRFLRSCQSGEFQRFIQDTLLSRYVEDPRKVSMVLCFSIASITDTECGEMAFNFNSSALTIHFRARRGSPGCGLHPVLVTAGPGGTTAGGLEGLRQYVNMSGLRVVNDSTSNHSNLQSVMEDIMDTEQRDAFQLHWSQTTSGDVSAIGEQSAMSAMAEVLQKPVRVITALESSYVDVLFLPSQPLSTTVPVVPVVIGAYGEDHYARIDYVIPEVPSQAATSGGADLHSDSPKGGTAEESEGFTWEKTDGGHSLQLKTTINSLTEKTCLPNKTDSRWSTLTAVTFTDCTVDLRGTEDVPTLEVLAQNMKQDLITLENVLTLIPQRSRVSKIYLAGNKLRQIPDGLGLLPNLTCLSAPKNKLKKIPAGIPDLGYLTVVDFNRNHLTKFPEVLQHLPGLKKVFLCFNKIKSIPAGVLPNMKSLKVLALDKNHLKGVPQDIVKCNSLVELHVKGNPLSSMPRMVFSMPSLRLLGVDRKVWEGFRKHNDDIRYRVSFDVCFDKCEHMSYDGKQLDTTEATGTTIQKAEHKLKSQLEEEHLPKQGFPSEEEYEQKQGCPSEQDQEDLPIAPSAEMSLTTHVSSMDDYNSTYRRSIEDPGEFWREISEEFHWETGPKGKFVEHNFDPNVGDVFVRWMPGATTNITYNLLEKNIREKCLGSTTALQWQGDDDVETREVTYDHLKSLVCRAANMLKAKGIRRGDRVMIYMPQTIEQVVAMLACARVGAVHCVVYGGATAEYLADRVKDSKCTAIITADFAGKDGGRQPVKTEVDRALKLCGREHFVRFCVVVRRVGVGDQDTWPKATGSQESSVPWCDGRDYWWQEEMERVDDECEPEWMDAEDPLLILYTSGSTGSPKGVIHTVGGYMMYAATTFKYVFDCGNVANKVHFCTADLGWVTGQSYVVYGPLLNGVTTVLLEGDPLKANRIVSMVRKYSVTSLYTTPTAIRHMKATSDSEANYKLDSLRVVGTVGEPIATSTWRWYRSTIGGDHCSVVDTYWQTETGGHVMTPLPGATPMKPGSATLPFFGVEPAVLTDDGREMVGPCEGHLVFKSPWPGMMRGINGKPEKFTSYFEQFPGYYYTGDRCRRDGDGYYRILGRRRTESASPEPWGRCKDSHPDVEDVAVVTTDPTDDTGECHSGGYDNWYIFVTLRQTACLHAQTIFTHLREMLATSLHVFTPPSHIHCASELPRTWSDKVLRRLLRKVVLNDLDLGDFHVVANLKSLPKLFRQCRDMQTSCQPIDMFTKPRTMPS